MVARVVLAQLASALVLLSRSVSLLTELVVALVVRTRRPFLRSRPGRLLLVSTVVLVAVALVMPYLPGIDVRGFAPLPLALSLTLVAITGAYVVAVEALKRWFYRRCEPAG